ncbi:TetR/AcrR family transcriptional regulator [Listeria costaricensis]|uniref:TetR/AcrR family transcriptional regulator n=1 Tax=Listeria costaricensis TaxID=2026604 RepID=UPI000C06C1B7|nr:TetR/AcrR family transcriptional regulator [Listeria costaricensis]
MTLRSRNDQEKALLKEKIQNAAVEIIVKEGYHKLSIRKIAQKIGYSPTTIYNYFKNKEDILESIAISVYSETIITIQQYFSENPTLNPLEKLEAGCTTFIQTMVKNPEKFRAVMLSGHRQILNQPENTQHLPHGTELLQQILEEGVQQNIFRPVSDETAEMILVALMGFVFHIVSEQIEDDQTINTMSEHYLTLLIQGLKKEDLQ